MKSHLAEVFLILTERVKQSKSLYNLDYKILLPIKLHTSRPNNSAISRDELNIRIPKKLPSSVFSKSGKSPASFCVSNKYVLVKRGRVVT
jgi:hypothetical protein